MITSSDIGNEIGVTSPSAEQLALWDRWISWTTALISRRYPDLGILDQGLLDLVLTGVVAEKAGNPGRVTQVDVAIDDGRVSKRYETHKGSLSAILEDWWDVLEAEPQRASNAWSINPIGSTVPVEPSTTSCDSWGRRAW